MNDARLYLFLGNDDCVCLRRIGGGEGRSDNNRARSWKGDVGGKPAVSEGAEVEAGDPNGANDVH